MALSRGKKLLFPLGQFGLVLSSYGVLRQFSDFYVSRPGSDSVFPVHLYQGYLFGLFTVAGLIIALSRIVDACACLCAGWLSDRFSPVRGFRRTGFMAFSVLPVALFSVLVFTPPTQELYRLNSVFVLVLSLLFFVFLSLYTVPYLALLAEIGRSPRVRMQLSTLMACATAFASLLGNRAFTFGALFSSRFGMSMEAGYRAVLAVFALLSAVCMLLPVLFLNESAETVASPVRDSFQDAVSAVFHDSHFKHYLIADILYRVSSAFIVYGFSYYVTGLLSLPQESGAFLLLVIFFANLALYIPVYVVSQRLGKRKILFIAFFMFMLFIAGGAFAGKYPISAMSQGYLFAFLLAIPLSVFSVVPNALISDLAVASERKTGVFRSGMYFGIHGFATRSAQLAAVVLVPLLLRIGSAPEFARRAGITGMRVTLVLAAVFSLTGFLFLFGYHEKEVSVLLEKNP